MEEMEETEDIAKAVNDEMNMPAERALRLSPAALPAGSTAHQATASRALESQQPYQTSPDEAAVPFMFLLSSFIFHPARVNNDDSGVTRKAEG